MGAWFSSTFLASVERRLWLAWIIATTSAGLAIANTVLIGGLLLVLIVGVLPGWLVARTAAGTFGPALQEHTHDVALRRARSPHLVFGLLVPAIALTCVAAPAALAFLVATVGDLMSGVATILGALLMCVLTVLYVAAVFAVGVLALAALWSASTGKRPASIRKPKAEARRDQTVELDVSAPFRRAGPPVQRS
jgi:hypothetical protein